MSKNQAQLGFSATFTRMAFSSSMYWDLTLRLAGRTVPCLSVGQPFKMVVTRSVQISSLEGVVLAFGESFRIGRTEFPPRTLLRRGERSWARVSATGAFEKVLAGLKQGLTDNDSSNRRTAARAAGHLGCSGKPCVPQLIAALKDREESAANAAAQSLKRITGQEFGKDQAAWQRWLTQQGPG